MSPCSFIRFSQTSKCTSCRLLLLLPFLPLCASEQVILLSKVGVWIGILYPHKHEKSLSIIYILGETKIFTGATADRFGSDNCFELIFVYVNPEFNLTLIFDKSSCWNLDSDVIFIPKRLGLCKFSYFYIKIDNSI